MIGRCVEALLAQTYPRELTEILVIDNGSTDDTRAIVARYPVTLLLEHGIRTAYAARNRGIRQASGTIIALTDGDCVPALDWLERMVAPFSAPSVAAVLGSIGDVPPETLWEEFAARTKPFSRPERRGLKTFLTGNAAVRRETLFALGLFDEHLSTAGDIDFGWRLQLSRQGTVVDVPEAIVLHRHSSSLREVFSQYRRYGHSEVLLSTLYAGDAGSTSSLGLIVRLLDQTRAALWCLPNLALRTFSSDRRRRMRPLYLFTIESASIVGKLGAIISTSGLRRAPHGAGRRMEGEGRRLPKEC